MAKINSTAHKGGLNREEVMAIRQALLIGLASYGEIQRLQNAVGPTRSAHWPAFSIVAYRSDRGR
jgi:hypothetical protein